MSSSSPSLRDYASLGWKLFPCHSIENGACSCKDENCSSPGKHPRIYNGVNGASGDVKQLKIWYDQFPGCNWGLATGQASGVIAVDIDQRKGGFESFDEYEQNRTAHGDFGNTLIANTGGGGRHIILGAPDHPVRNRVNWRPGVDIRADGGYIILPPGSHISGGKYEWRNWGHPIMTAPDDFIYALTDGGNFGSGDTSIIKDLTVDSFVDGIDEGARDDTIFRMACKLRRQLGDNRAAVTLLCLEAARNSTPPFPEKEAMKKIDQAFKQDHTDLEVMIFQGGGDDEEDDSPIAHLTDMGNRDRFLQAFGDDYRYVVGLGWHKWADDGWHQVDDLTPHRDAQEVPEMIREDAKRVADLTSRQKFMRWANDTESSGKIASILTMARGHERIKKMSEDFDNDPYVIACANGMLDLRSGRLRPFNRDDLFTKNTRIVYEEGYRLGKWDNFIKVVTDGDEEMANYLQMSAGYSLTGLVREESFFIVSGARQTGKSTFGAAIEGAMGSYSDVASAEVFMKRYGKEAPREELVKFFGSRLISVEEIPEGERFDDALLKRITGGTKLSARYLYQEMFSYFPQFKIWFYSNYDPITSDEAMYRRIKRITFDVKIPEEKKDRTLKAVFADRSTGGKAILAWMVEGAMKYLDAGELRTPTRVLLATAAYQQEQDSFSHFLNETFQAVPGDRLAETTVYQLHSEWAKRNNERYLKRPQFAQKLRERGFDPKIDEETETRYVEGLRVRAATIFPTQAPFQS